ncbi:putative polysaccharide biosynthesis protein [Kickxella alabastrina]|uniref:putative polysaccharide biosynthesis protein n=1 Tax=Kickxella alabastrina TaxID=61397 RepID=UPI00221F3B05|nr:putative polysaccharide biosynthesis protein [Kickxella alabastrina]XP_051393056.1 putative polysaccharide biosynthesis protein [Kickxella alabastrina]KAI7819867.1 putative polysaccharide biosynthesis protein [Kickxella alabastrina]KAI7831970.1 putative polysaccharide biosynthesis protein [Kickxella alabastrina]KAJ1943207.1 hypothetical protein GGF37_002749 [Kickxella alabastrina]
MALPSADQTGNMAEMEMQWAVKAMHHAETYMQLLKAVGGKNFKLTPIDDELYSDFKRNFPDLNIAVLNDDDFKTDMAKAKWREFINKYENRVTDFNFGSLLRIDCTGDYSEDNTMFVMRTQFYCIEIARNKEGLNDSHHS